MMAKSFDATAAERLRAGVRAVEQASALEVVVRVVPWSGSYRDVRWRTAALLAFAALVAMVFAPVIIGDMLALVLVLLAGAVGWLVAGRPAVTRWQTSTGRRAEQVLRAARACFHEEAVAVTRGRTGVLLYASVLEDRALTLRDHPLEGRAPLAEWGAIDRLGRPDGSDLRDRLDGMLGALGTLGARVAPPRADETNELPDAPRIDA